MASPPPSLRSQLGPATWTAALLLFLLLIGHVQVATAAARVTARQNETTPGPPPVNGGRERVSINAGWRFRRFERSPNDGAGYAQLRQWILPSANDFIRDASKHHQPPDRTRTPPPRVSFAQAAFDDSGWERLSVPHDWAAKGPFYRGDNVPVGGGMGRLPIQGVGWYRRTIALAAEDAGKAVYLEVDGAMAYAAVWVNGELAGGWPYGYASFRVDLTPFVKEGANVLAVRVENELDSSRWYPGAGIYRNVWLTKVSPTHVGQSGTYLTSAVSGGGSATLALAVQVENSAAPGGEAAEVEVVTDVHVLDAATGRPVGDRVAQFPWASVTVAPGSKRSANSTVELPSPRLWGPLPDQTPNLYVAVTRLWSRGAVLDTYETRFGVRTVEYRSDGLYVNGRRVYLQGVCQHHDLGALGAAVNRRALERQLELLQEMGSNAVRTSHNPPAPELLELTDQMGILVLDEIFDTWASPKTRNDFSRIFADWGEADLRAFVRRDRNHPSVVLWSYGNEVAEQRQGGGPNTARRLRDVQRDEDPTRRATVGMNTAAPDGDFVRAVDAVGLNYQGEGLGYGAPTFARFRQYQPDKMIFSTESSSALSTRGTYTFPVAANDSSMIRGAQGADPAKGHVSAYELYAADWGSSPDKVFAAQDAHRYVAGEFVWTGWDYLGEPTPFYSSRSSYFGIVDLAGFKKDRFHLYQARWRPQVRSAHILPHWTWPADRVGQVTPVHVFSSADQAELFVNGVSQGRVTRRRDSWRLRWDRVVYAPGELRVVAYKDGAEWATETVRTAGGKKALRLSTYRGRTTLAADGEDLSFISVAVVDDNGDVVPRADDAVSFEVAGPGELVATDNGDPTDLNPFPSAQRKAFSGKALAIVRATAGASGQITVSASASGLEGGKVTLTVA